MRVSGYVPDGVPFLPGVVVTVAVAVDVLVPLSTTEVGDTVQLAAGGAPEQLSATVPVNPPVGVKVSPYFADLPFTVCPEGIAVIEKSVPVPESVTDCGLPEASSVTVIAPVLVPVAVGVKLTLIAQLAPAARVFGESGQLFV
jgi:hypothetical protein